MFKNSLNVGSISGVDIVIDYELSMRSVEKLVETNELYKHYLFVSDDFIADDSGCTIVCRGRDRSFLADDVAAEIHKEDEQGNEIKVANEIIITNSKVDKKEATPILLMTSKQYMYLADIEETKELDKPNDVILAKTIAKMVGNNAGVSQATLEKLINRQSVITTKEISGRRRVK